MIVMKSFTNAEHQVLLTARTTMDNAEKEKSYNFVENDLL